MVDEKEIREALTDARDALDDWMHTFADDLCNPADVERSMDRIMRNGGTLYYIATLRERLNDLLGRV